jgi:hypothetical protein
VRENVLIYLFTLSVNFLLNVIFPTSLFPFFFRYFWTTEKRIEVQIERERERENSINRSRMGIEQSRHIGFLPFGGRVSNKGQGFVSFLGQEIPRTYNLGLFVQLHRLDRNLQQFYCSDC